MKARISIFIAMLMAQVFAMGQTRFLAVDVFIDPQGEPLAAYQIEITGEPGVKFVGVEGGNHPEFRKAPFYDPKALQGERLIVGAFATGKTAPLPTMATRVMTLHLQFRGTHFPKLQTNLKVAATLDSKRIDAEIKVTERKQ